MNAPASPSPLVFHKSFSFIALIAIGAVAWVFMIQSEVAMTTMDGDGPIMELMWMMMRPGDALTYLVAAALMWIIMMLGMMIPAVWPMAMIFRRMDRGTSPELNTLIFASGYLLGWSLFAVAAAAIQLALHAGDLLRGHMLAASPFVAGTILVTAGLYQLTPFKEACLQRCRSPFGFFMEHWSPGTFGALKMGLRHGVYCVGCCWGLMLLMFVGGAMSVVTMAALCVFILAERLLPPGPWVSKIPGLALTACGASLLILN